MSKKLKSVVITGPTATGKTALAVKLAANFNGEIVSVDSRQVYRGLDIGSGKDLDEYVYAGQPAPYHLIDVAEPMAEYNLLEFCRDAWAAVKTIAAAGKLPILCGGAPLYLDAMLSGYRLPGGPPNPELRRQMNEKSNAELLDILQTMNPKAEQKFKDGNNRPRLLRAIERAAAPADALAQECCCGLDPLIIGIYFPRQEVHRRIEERLDRRLANGMIEEVEQLHQRGVSWERLEFFGLEYRFVALHLQGKLGYAEMRNRLLYRIRQFAKRQDIWFRKLEREGCVIHWLDQSKGDDPLQLVEAFIAGHRLPAPAITLKNIFYGPQSK